MASLSEQGWKRAYVDGGKIIQSFMREGLIADMTVTIVPILIGAGKSVERQPSWPVATTPLAGGAERKTGMPVWRAAPPV
jgi:dihydrofolate reductase